ncbi:agamous-like MADS-box protein AGL80 [Silene latifolia]|uniref:agamous-like MADS-box protein AGL80 n=1 Tax=Silene latifolia TaxID=37657 RepID=UPI003D76EB1E
MTRSRVKLEFMVNDSARKATFKKRKKGLLKKIEELTTLCGVDACAIICSPYDAKPEVWPNSTGARRVLSRFNNLSEEDQGKKMLDQESYLRQRVSKASQQLVKMKRDTKEKEVRNLMFDVLNGERSVDGLDLNDTKNLCVMADVTLDLITKAKAKLLNGNEASSPSFEGGFE